MKIALSIALIIAFGLIGCQDSNINEVQTTSTKNIIQMQINTTYKVLSGDKVEKRSDDAQIKIKKNSEQSTTEVTLLVGKAVIIKK